MFFLPLFLILHLYTTCIFRYNAKYPDCDVKNDQMKQMGNGRCEGDHNTAECGYEDGDCVGK